MEFNEKLKENLKNCPWCKSLNNQSWGEIVRGFLTVKCQNCGLIFVKNRLSQRGLEEYYKKYFSENQQTDAVLNQQRQKMYKLEFELIRRFSSSGTVLDVGCGGGYFLDIFKQHGYDCYGEEFSQEAVREAAKKYQIYFGDFPQLKIKKTFDLIIFRGVIEHVPNPREYLDKAVALLNKNGLMYITSTPNADSFCAELFEENWNQHEPEAHLMHFRPKHFDDYFKKQGFGKLAEYYFYQETQYANVAMDILQVAKAIQFNQAKQKITFKSPAFWGNMMSLIYKKF